MCLLKGCIEMRSDLEIISSNDKEKFKEQVNKFLDISPSERKKIIEIKFFVTPNATYEYNAFILWSFF